MRILPRALALATALALVPVAARAQQTQQTHKGLGDWSVVGAEINTGKPFEDVQAGWPNVNFGYTFNLGKTSDMGLRFGLLYGLEGTTSTQFGLGLWAPIRFQLSHSEKFNLIFHVDPGVRIYFAGSTCVAGTNICADTSKTQFAFTFPVGLVGGFPVAHNLEIGGGLDLNLALAVTSPVNFVIGPWAGPYVEYHFDNPNIAIGLNTRFGVMIPTATGSSAAFAFMVQAFAGYRLF
jgi:hypothetical protein